MALARIEELIEQYFRGETSIEEERELREYFSSSNVAQHLEQYKSIFEYFSQEKQQQLTQKIPLKTNKRNRVVWLSIAATTVVMLGIGTFLYQNQTQNPVSQGEYGTYDNPELALKETQKALALVSGHLNTGIESVKYINEYNKSRNRIFKKTIN